MNLIKKGTYYEKIITAIGNEILNEKLKKQNNFEVIIEDIQYKEGILELLENNTNIDYIILEDNLSGEIKTEELIVKILEKNKKIKIIIINNKKEKNNYKNKNVINLFINGEINLEKIINYNKIKNIENKNNKNEKKTKKIILFFGARKVGKTSIMIKMAYYLKEKNYKILLIENNKFDKELFTILNKNNQNKHIIKINEKIDIMSCEKNLIKKELERLIENYNFILIESNYIKKDILENNIIKKILILQSNILEIKNAEKILKKNEKEKEIKILINNYNKNSISEDIIKEIFKNNKIIGKINYNENCEKIINNNKIIIENNENIEFEKILNQI